MKNLKTIELAKSLNDMAQNLEKMKRYGVIKAMAKAINVTMTAARQEVVTKTAKNNRVGADKVRKKIPMRRATAFGNKKILRADKLSARVTIYMVGIPLISLVTGKDGTINYNSIRPQFKSQKRRVTKLGGTGIFGNLGKANSRGTKRGRFLQRAFVNQVNGKVHILQRKGRERYDITVPRVEVGEYMESIFDKTLRQKEDTVYLKTLEHEFYVRMKDIVK